MADNFDTPEAVKSLSELLAATNSYLQQERNLIKLPLVRQVSKYILKILKVFGVYDEDVVPTVGNGTDSGAASSEESIVPLMDVLSKFRDTVKDRAAEGAPVIS